MVALTGRHEAYYTDYRGRPQEFISAAKYGYLFQGQPYTVAGSAPRNADFRRRSGSFRRLHRESRSGFEFSLWRTRALSDFSRPLSGDDCVAHAWTRGRQCFSRARNSARRVRLFISPTCREICAKRCAWAVSNFWPNFHRWPGKEIQRQLPRPIRPGSLRPVQTRFLGAGDATSHSTICTATS